MTPEEDQRKTQLLATLCEEGVKCCMAGKSEAFKDLLFRSYDSKVAEALWSITLEGYRVKAGLVA